MNVRDQHRKATQETEENVQMISFSIDLSASRADPGGSGDHHDVHDHRDPERSGFVEGVINLRGNIIPVIDLRKDCGCGAIFRWRPGDAEARTLILVVEIEGSVTGFIVDSVAKVIRVPASRISLRRISCGRGPKPIHQRVVHLDEGILVILDFRRILSMEEKDALEAWRA